MRLMRFLRAERRLGKVLQKQIRPFPNGRVFALVNDLQDVVVSRLEPFAEFLLCLLPISRFGRFFMTLPSVVAVAYPPKRVAVSTVDDAVMFTRSRHSPPPV